MSCIKKRNREKRNLGIIIQARTGSTRLPGKVMKKACGKPLLQLMLERLSHSEYYNRVIIATTYKSRDDVIVELCKEMGVVYFRGSEDDVLDRYVKCAFAYDRNVIVRLTSDCPLMDPTILDEMVDEYYNNNYNVYSNVHPRTYPDGMDIEIFTIGILVNSWESYTSKEIREHVTGRIFTDNYYENKLLDTDLSSVRLTLDYEKDYTLIKEIFENLYRVNELFTLQDIMKYLGGVDDK